MSVPVCLFASGMRSPVLTHPAHTAQKAPQQLQYGEQVTISSFTSLSTDIVCPCQTLRFCKSLPKTACGSTHKTASQPDLR